MILRSTPHAHTAFVDGKNSAEEMVLAALSAGFVSIGLSEHGAQPIDSKYGLNGAEGERAYIAEVMRLRSAYAGRIRVHLGIERDTYSTAVRDDYDYVIGSAHYLPLGGEIYAADGPAGQLIECRDKHFGGDGAKLAIAYFQQLANYAAEYKPDILGHFDVVRKSNKNGVIYDGGDPAVRRAQYDALEAIYASGALLEVNTGGMARGYLDTPYPEVHLLRYWRGLGGGVIAGSDSHSVATIDFGFDQLPGLLRDAGFETAWELGGEGEARFVERSIL